jgi:hypothetical protein
MKDEKVIDWKEGFSQLSFDKENKLKEGSWEALGWGKVIYLTFLEEEENKCVRGKLFYYV